MHFPAELSGVSVMGVLYRRTSYLSVGGCTSSFGPRLEQAVSPGQNCSSEGNETQLQAIQRLPTLFHTGKSPLDWNLLSGSVSVMENTSPHRVCHHRSCMCRPKWGSHSSWTSGSSALPPPHMDIAAAVPSFASGQRKVFPSYYIREVVCRSNPWKSRTCNAVSTCRGTLALKHSGAATHLEGDWKPFLDTWALQIWFPQLIKRKQKGVCLSKEESHSTFPTTDQASSVSVGGAGELKGVTESAALFSTAICVRLEHAPKIMSSQNQKLFFDVNQVIQLADWSLDKFQVAITTCLPSDGPLYFQRVET